MTPPRWPLPHATKLDGIVTEKQLQDAVVEIAKLLGWLVYHTHDSRKSEPGFPDLTLVRDDRLAFAEMKRGGGKLTAEQTRWIAALVKAGVEAHVWRPSDWDEIVRILGARA